MARRRKKNRSYTLVQLRNYLRDVVYDVFNEAGYRITRKGVNESVYIDTSKNWWVDRELGASVVVNFEQGYIASPSFSKAAAGLLYDVSDVLEDDLGKGFYIEYYNAAIGYLVIPRSVQIKG